MIEVRQPLFFLPNRVWRCYTGGALLDKFVGGRSGDGHFPEDWLASTVKASNGVHSTGQNEGVAEIVGENGEKELLSDVLEKCGTDILGQKHFNKFGLTTGVLCKYLDSSVRLPVQCHPDRDTAMKLYNSRFGKAESWHIIDTRVIEGQKPYILMGFKTGVKREDFLMAAYAEDGEAMAEMMHRIEVKPAETYFVPARLPHAIGTGVFMLEVQEPSDLVVTPERYCADVRLTDEEMWGPLAKEQAIEIFDYTAMEKAELLRRVSAKGWLVKKDKNVEIRELIGSSFTDAFGLWSVAVKGVAGFEIPRAFAVVVVERGEGEIRWRGGSRTIRQGEYFLWPASVSELEYSAKQGLDLLVCLPPET